MPLQIAGALNSRLEKLMPVMAPAGVILGFLFPPAFIWLRPFVPWLFAVTTLSGALRLRARELGAALQRPLPLLVYFFSVHAVMPVLVFILAGIIFPGDTDTKIGRASCRERV